MVGMKSPGQPSRKSLLTIFVLVFMELAYLTVALVLFLMWNTTMAAFDESSQIAAVLWIIPFAGLWSALVLGLLVVWRSFRTGPTAYLSNWLHTLAILSLLGSLVFVYDFASQLPPLKVEHLQDFAAILATAATGVFAYMNSRRFTATTATNGQKAGPKDAKDS